MNKEQVLTLENYYEIMKIPKTQTKIFKDLKVGDIIHIEWDMVTERGYRGIYAIYPRVNGQVSSGVSQINSLISNGMELRKLDVGEVAKLIEDERRRED